MLGSSRCSETWCTGRCSGIKPHSPSDILTFRGSDLQTVKMGKRGTLVLPAKVRKQFGLEEGSLLVTEVKDGEIRLRPASVYEPEVWSPERKAELLLNNAVTREEWDEIALDVKSWGLDPSNLPG